MARRSAFRRVWIVLAASVAALPALLQPLPVVASPTGTLFGITGMDRSTVSSINLGTGAVTPIAQLGLPPDFNAQVTDLTGDAATHRIFVLREAQRLGLTGWVRNRADGSVEVTVEGLEDMARIAAARGQPRQAARLFGAAEALRSASGVVLPPYLRAPIDHAVQAVREALGVGAFAEAWAEGAQLSLEQAIAAALTPI